MRKYRISFLKEVNDECTEREVFIFAGSFEKALEQFKEEVRRYKRITEISELPLGT